jgi:uncharacterized OB-fold protein
MTFEYIPGIPVMHPVVDDINREYWEAMKRHELVIQKCNNCGHQVHPPRPMCPTCLSTDRGWRRSNGKGVIYTWVNFVYARAAYPGIKSPYAVVVVEMEDSGARILSNVVDIDPKDIYIGMGVEAVFTHIDDELTLVHFKKRDK